MPIFGKSQAELLLELQQQQEQERIAAEKEKKISDLETRVALLEQQIADLGAKVQENKDSIPDVRSEGASWFADKLVQKIVYGFVGMALVAIGSAVLANVGLG